MGRISGEDLTDIRRRLHGPGDRHRHDGVSNSTRQVARVSLTGGTVDQVLIEGFDELASFLSGKALGRLLEDLF